MRAWSARLGEGLAEASRGSSGTAWRRLGAKLVVIELATAMVLLVGAGLFGKSLYYLLHVPLGMNPDRLVTIDVSAPDSSYGKDSQAIALARLVTSRTETLPGVTSVGIAVNGVPVTGNGNTTWLRVLGRPWNGEHYDVAQRHVSAAYFSTLGASLLRGRYFEEGDDSSKPRVVIVNQAFVKSYFPGEDPIGRQVARVSLNAPPMTIVGIVEDIREGPLDAPIPPVLYEPFNQQPDDDFSLVVRTVQSEAALLPAIAAVIHQIDPGIVSVRGATMTARVNDSQSAYLHRSLAWLVGGFAILALLMGVVGLYGVIAYSVSLRRREIGIRMALGAQPLSVHGLILKEAGRLTTVGILIGLVGSVGTATLMHGLLFGVRSWDVVTLLSVAAVLGLAAIVASFIPARRAASVNPVEALRAE
jgi:predicted permease